MGDQQIVRLTGSHGKFKHGDAEAEEVKEMKRNSMRELAYMIQILDNTNIFAAFVLSKDILYITLSKNGKLKNSNDK